MKREISITNARVSRIIYAATAILAAGVSSAQPLAARDYQAEIDALKAEVGGLSGTVDNLQLRGDTLEEAMANLQAQINHLQSQIADNQNKRDELTGKITKAKNDIVEREDVLSQNLRRMYLSSDMSSLEQVASSKSISEYVDKQEYRNRIQERVSTALNEIETLKQQLEGQKKKVERLILDDQAMKQQVDTQKAAKAKLLAQTRGKEAKYQEVIAGKQEKITDLQAQQAAAIAAAAAQANSRFVSFGSGGGGYPYAGVSMFPCQGDPWGMCMRQCVSYTAWKVASTGRHMPFWGGIGNANQWPGNAQAVGIPTGYTPKAGAVAVMMSGPYGHTMYVEKVLNGGAQIRVSEYNYAWDGRYTERIQSSAGLIYIYF